MKKIFKVNCDPLESIKRKDYLKYLGFYFFFGRSFEAIFCNRTTRLVTNGTKFLSKNNQPIITDNIIGVHNGIIINNNIENQKEYKSNFEGYNSKSDCFKFV